MEDREQLSEVEQLKARVEQLEKLLTARAQPQQITAEEVAAYRKVADVLAADWGEFCGINDCYRPPVLRCVRPCVIRCVIRCINECGPEPYAAGRYDQLARFEQLGF